MVSREVNTGIPLLFPVLPTATPIENIMKQALKSGDEVDAITARKWYNWKSGQVRKIKRALNKRNRKEGKRDIQNI